VRPDRYRLTRARAVWHLAVRLWPLVDNFRQIPAFGLIFCAMPYFRLFIFILNPRMKKSWLVVGLLAAVPFCSVAQTKKPVAKPAPPATTPKPQASTSAAPAAGLRTQMDSVSYAMGMYFAQNFIKSQGVEGVNLPVLNKAMQDVLGGGTPTLSEDQFQKVLMAFSQRLSTQREAENAKKYEAEKAAGEKFLAENKSRSGVVTLPSGLQYEILKAGEGPKPTAADRVKTHYHGTFPDGKVFDSSVQRGEPISFAVTGVIPGWTEALQLMPVGSKWKLFVPYQLAYGEQGSPGGIPPYSALVFEVELLEIEK
jgi:FKBP-type peptidyl-prolyl cis-trans isomerase FklB